MVEVALTLLRFLWPFIVGGMIWWWADAGWCNKACTVQKTAVSTLRGQLEKMNTAAFKQQERWSNVVAAEEMRVKERDKAKRFAEIRARASVDSPDRRVPLSDGTRRLLGDAYQAAQAAESAAAPATAAPANSATVAALAEWGVDILKWADACRDRVGDWEHFYKGLQDAENDHAK